MASSRENYQHKQRLLAAESLAVISVNIALSVAAIVALVKLTTYNLEQRATINLLDAEVQETEIRVDGVREEFSQYFDPQQKSSIMRQQSRRVKAGQARLILIEPDSSSEHELIETELSEMPESERLETEILESEGIDSEQIGPEPSEVLESERLETEVAESGGIDSERLETEVAESEGVDSERLETEVAESEGVDLNASEGIDEPIILIDGPTVFDESEDDSHHETHQVNNSAELFLGN